MFQHLINRGCIGQKEFSAKKETSKKKSLHGLRRRRRRVSTWSFFFLKFWLPF
jgi:hypothetical protein